MRRLLWILLPPAAIAPIVVVLFYVYALGYGALSHRASDWAEFGEYVGGTLGAIYGFLAFIGVLVTLTKQQSQSELDEMQRLLASESQRIDSILDSEPRQPDGLFRERQLHSGNVFSVYSLLSYASAAAIVRSEDKGKQAKQLELKETSLRQIKAERLLLNIELPRFVELSQRYSRTGGSAAVVSHYEGKYALPVAFMDLTGQLDSDSVRKYFRRSGTALTVCRTYEIPTELAYAGPVVQHSHSNQVSPPGDPRERRSQ